jgi:hypothetical protein
MPLAGSAPVLSAAIRAAMIADPRTRAVDDTTMPADEKALTAFCDVIAEVVLAHIVANAVVAGTGGGAAPVVGSVL